MKCTMCGSENPDESEFCGVCGKPKEKTLRPDHAREIYQENRDIIDGWEWVAAKSARTCITCLLMDGQAFSLETKFQSHEGCRCTIMPVLKGGKSKRDITGREWFYLQEEEIKKSILGEREYQNLLNGKSLEEIAGIANK